MSHSRTTTETTTTEYDDEGRIARQVVVTVETVEESTP
jgi:hypothetical protein